LTPEEQKLERRDQERRHRQWERAIAFRETDVYKNARDAAFGKDKDPDRIVRSASALCEAMYEQVERAPDNSLELGYWTNELTKYLAKLNRFEEALSWITRFDTVSGSVKLRTSTTVAEAIRKRRTRCEAALTK
jgi:hypothetical protein